MKKITKVVALLFTFACVSMGISSMKADAVEFAQTTVPILNNAAELDTISASYTTTVNVTKGHEETTYASFTLAEDSWVMMTGNYSMYTGEEGGSTHVDVYADSSLSNKKGEFGFGYWEYGNTFSAFLNKGTYYYTVKTKYGNYDGYKGNVNIIVGSMPISKVFNVSTSVAKNKKSAVVSVVPGLGKYVSFVEYRQGAVALSNVSSSTYWKWKIAGIFTGGDGATVLNPVGEAYSFSVKKNGDYTIMLQDTAGARYSVVYNVKGIDRTKPKVTGVKNNKKYKKAVKIKFSDKQTGIKSAKLNGKKIKSGKKVSKKGSYKLVVIDKAGNKTTIKFKIKK